MMDRTFQVGVGTSNVRLLYSGVEGLGGKVGKVPGAIELRAALRVEFVLIIAGHSKD
jgi:hypothetical protein